MFSKSTGKIIGITNIGFIRMSNRFENINVKHIND